MRAGPAPLLLVAVTIAACAGSSPPAPATPPPEPTASALPTPSGPVSPPAIATLEADIRTAVGGLFAVDHLGPDEHGRIVRELRADPGATLDVFERLCFERGAGAPLAPTADLPGVLQLLQDVAAERVGLVARRLGDRVAEALNRAGPEDRTTLEQRLRQLALLAGGLDAPVDPAARVVAATRVCVEELPGGGRVLRVLRDCTCGEPLACRVSEQGAVLTVALWQNPGPAVCDDCYPGWASCSLPTLTGAQPITLRNAGRVLVTTTTDAVGRVTVGCP